MIGLPFFEKSHRDLHRRFDAFVRERIEPLAGRDEQDTDAVARRYVARLAKGGWLEYVDPVRIRACCLIRERLAYASALADDMFAMQGLGGLPIAMFGNADQKRQWLSRIRRGAIGAFALTEPDAGSDPAGMRLAAARRGDSYVLSGEKTFISNAGLADVYVVFARLGAAGAPPPPPPSQRGESRKQGGEMYSAFVVPGDAAGLRVEPVRLIAAHPIGTVRFDGVVVPVSARLGGEGDGLRIALATLDRFRASVAAAACGMARRALDEALRHVQSRRQFGKPLSAFQGVQFMLADMATELDAAQLLVARAAWMVDAENVKKSKSRKVKESRQNPDSQAAIKRAVSTAKLFATDHAHAIIDRAVQLLGGRGLVSGHPVERLYREIRALRIYEGTSEIQRLVIARTMTNDGRSG